MPNIKSAIKRVKVTQTKTLQNKMVKSALKTDIKKAVAAIESGSADRESLVKAAISNLDSASHTGMMHKNTAARKKSALARKSNAKASV